MIDVGGPVAAVGQDAARIVDVIHQEVGRLRRDHDLERKDAGHHLRHAVRNALGRVVAAQSAGGAVGDPRFIERLVRAID